MERLNREYIEILSKEADASEKFWELEKRIRNDKKKTGVQVSMSRSEMIYDILSLINEGAISVNDIDDFSDELKEGVKFMLGIRRRT